jgi:hypothetical protein
VVLDCSNGDEKRLGDLGVGHTLRRETRNHELRRGECVRTREPEASRPRPRRDRLPASPFGQLSGTASVCEIEAQQEVFTCLFAGSALTQHRPEIDQRSGVLETCRRVLELSHCDPESSFAVFGSVDQSQRTGGDADADGHADRLGLLQFLGRESQGFGLPSDQKREVRAPAVCERIGRSHRKTCTAGGS